ncbi:MAG TPA: YigZ family protein [Thermoanaerobaculia bacterium]
MPPPADYLAPRAAATGELRERGSRFLAVVAPAADEAAAGAVVAGLAADHPDATHVCFAWRLGPVPRERASDAGEPSGTAGVPILQVLRGRELSDVVAVVVRWFGGTKLGKGGLARAYAAAARLAAEELPVERRFARAELTVELPYERIGAVKRLLHPPEVELAAERYGERVELVLSVRADRRDELAAALADLGLAAAVKP